MRNIQTIIAESEKEESDKLIGKLKLYCPNVEIIATCQSGKEAVEAIQLLQPQLVFLNDDLGTMTAFDVLKLVSNVPFEFILTSSKNQYALEAIRAGARDYLLKPINNEDLIEAVYRAWWKIYGREQSVAKRIIVPVLEGMRFLPISSIIYCEAGNNLVTFHLLNEAPLTVAEPIRYFQEILPASQFFRIHRRYIVNIHFVRLFNPSDGGYAEMEGGAKLPISKNKKEAFLKRMMEY